MIESTAKQLSRIIDPGLETLSRGIYVIGNLLSRFRLFLLDLREPRFHSIYGFLNSVIDTFFPALSGNLVFLGIVGGLRCFMQSQQRKANEAVSKTTTKRPIHV